MIVAACAVPGSAEAGRTFFGWLLPTEVMPERSVELQNWNAEVNRIEDAGRRSVSVWGASPMIGITDQLELALPFEVWWSREPGSAGSTQHNNVGLEARYRLVTQDPADAPPLAPLVRVALRRITAARDTARPEVDLVASYEAGRVLAAVDLGLVAELSADDARFGVRPAAGVSVRLAGELRAGAELFGIITSSDDGLATVEGPRATYLAAGPNLSWTHGRFWVSAAYGVGLTGVRTAPRLQWGIAF